MQEESASLPLVHLGTVWRQSADQGKEEAGRNRYYGQLTFPISATHFSDFVSDAPKEVTTVLQSPTPIREGDNVTLTCNYTSSNPRVTRYEWSPQGLWNELIPGVLMIQKVSWNAGPFTCAACNSWCSWASPVNLHIKCE